MANKIQGSNFFSTHVGSTPGNLLRLLGHHVGQPISFRYGLKFPIVFLASLFFAPFNWYESLRYGRKIRETELKSPIFIIGHWRSGTTHLHNMFSQDPQFGYTTMMQSMFPLSFLSNPLIPRLMGNLMPNKRPMDNMEIALRTPQEDELALSNLTPNSFLNIWLFPRKMWPDYQRYVRFKGSSEGEKRRWKKAFMKLCKKTAVDHGDKRLILKNPAHTGRVDLLLEMFPDARFIFLHRHPVDVFYSTRRLHLNAGPALHLQTVSEEHVDDAIFNIYEDLLGAYLEQKTLIPAENLVEIRYEDLEKRPVEIMAEIYEQLRIEDWEAVKPLIESYLNGIKNYKKNVHQFTEDECIKVQQRWQFAFDTFGYPPIPD